MADDFIPKDDAGVTDWINNFDDWIQEHGDEVGVSPAQKTQSAALRAAYNTNADAVEPARTAYQARVTAKDDSEDDYIAFARPTVAQIQVNPQTTDEERREMRIPIHKTTRTRVSVPTTAPICQINTGTRLRHILEFRDSATPNDRVKPEGVRGCQIFLFVGEAAPASENDYRFLAEDSKTPYEHDFEMSEVGKTAFYLLRWINTRNETGPWSSIVSATIGG